MGHMSVFLGGQPRSYLKGAGPQCPQIGISYRRSQTMRKHNQIVIKLDARKTITGSTTNADARPVCGS